MFRWLLLVLVLVAVAVGLVLGILNPDPVVLDLLVFSATLPLGALVMVTLASGVILGLVLALVLYAIPARLSRRGRSASEGEKRLTDQSNA